MIYPPREDSLLLAKWVRRFARGKVLDMGTGSGIQAQAAGAKKVVKSVLAVDVDPAVVMQCRKNVVNKKITCLRSDLFTNIPQQQFDTIIFNPPYLPQDLPERDVALEGGRQGHETVVRFLKCVNSFLRTKGQVLLLFSSLTNKNKVEEAIRQQLFDFKELDRLHIFFEDLFVHKITKSVLLKRIEKTGIKGLAYVTRGKRSWVYQGTHRGKKCAVKVKRPDAVANAPVKEGRILKIVNKLGLGPRLCMAQKGFVAYEWVPGRYLEDVLQKAGKAQKRSLFRHVFRQAFVLDQARLNKEEMLRPLKNAIMTPKGKLVLIDFERAYRTKRPHNVTQVCTFAARQGVAPLKTIHHWAAHYKRNPTRGNFTALLKGVGL